MTKGVASTWGSKLHLPSARWGNRPAAAPASPRPLPRWPIENVVVLAVCLLVVGALWLRVAEQARFERENVLQHAVAQNEAIAAAFEQYAVRTIEHADTVLLAVRREYARAGPLIDLDALLTELGIDRDAFQGIGIIDEKGDLIATTMVAGRRNANYVDREHFSIHVARDSGQPFVGKPVLSRLLGTMSVPITRRINRADGRFGGVVVVQIEPRRFTQIYRQVTLRPLDVLSVVGLDGITRARRVGDRESSGEDISASVQLDRWAAQPHSSYETAGALDGIQRLYSYKRLAGFPLVVTTGSAKTDVLADYAARKLKIETVAGAATAFIALIAALLLVVLGRNRKALATLAASEAQLSAMFSQAAVGIARSDMQGRLLQVNPKFCELVGYTEAELLTRSVIDITHPHDRLATTANMVKLNGAAAEVTSPEREKRYVRKDGGIVWVNVSTAATRDPLGSAIGLVAMVQDISRRKRTEHQIEYLATHDALTDLTNRNLLDDRWSQAKGQADRSAACLALLSIGLDHFKFVNHAYGHAVGDALLKAIAQRLRSAVRGSDTVARLDGDEFVILLTDLRDPLQGSAAAVRTVLDAFAQPFVVDGNEFPVTVSMGISLYPADGRGLDEMLKNAYAAMHRVKDLGRNGHQFYAREMSVKASARVATEVALRQALLLEQFELHYQPLVVIATGEVTGTEALLRWHHPELGSVSPVEFIPLAEETGLIIGIGDWVLRTACKQNKAWQDAGMQPLTVAVNLSAIQLNRPDFVASVERALVESGLDPQYLCLELTESMVMDNTGAVIDSLNHLRALGITLSMDDFGTGYSNLGHLTHLPLDILKIDRSFVRDVSTNGAAASIARAIVSMGRSLGMKVVAEGVESVEQAEFLASIWCEHAQGYMYCRPLPAAGFAAWMQQRRNDNRAGTPTEISITEAVA